MKPIVIIKVAAVLAVMVFTFTPVGVVAADMWQETPNLNEDSELPSAVIKPVVFVNRRPLVDQWVETPDLNAETDNLDFIPDDEGRFVGTLIPEMYAETPALDEIFAIRQPVADEDTMLAEGR